MLIIRTQKRGHAARIAEYLLDNGHKVQLKPCVVYTHATHDDWREAVPAPTRAGAIVTDTRREG